MPSKYFRSPHHPSGGPCTILAVRSSTTSLRLSARGRDRYSLKFVHYVLLVGQLFCSILSKASSRRCALCLRVCDILLQPRCGLLELIVDHLRDSRCASHASDRFCASSRQSSSSYSLQGPSSLCSEQGATWGQSL